MPTEALESSEVREYRFCACDISLIDPTSNNSQSAPATRIDPLEKHPRALIPRILCFTGAICLNQEQYIN